MTGFALAEIAKKPRIVTIDDEELSLGGNIAQIRSAHCIPISVHVAPENTLPERDKKNNVIFNYHTDSIEKIIKTIKLEKPAVIITDFNMVTFEAPELINAIRSEPELRDIPIMIRSSDSKKDIDDALLNAVPSIDPASVTYSLKQDNGVAFKRPLDELVAKANGQSAGAGVPR